MVNRALSACNWLIRELFVFTARSTSATVGGTVKAAGAATPGGWRVGQLAPLAEISTTASNQADDGECLKTASLSNRIPPTSDCGESATQGVVNRPP